MDVKEVSLFLNSLNDVESKQQKKRDKQCNLAGIVGKKVVIISLYSSIVQSTWQGKMANFGDANGKSEITLSTYWSPAASYLKYVSCMIPIDHPALIFVATFGVAQVEPDET